MVLVNSAAALYVAGKVASIEDGIGAAAEAIDFGSALAAEGIFAFFLESGFLAILLFGWDKVGPKMHFFATCMVALGAASSTSLPGAFSSVAGGSGAGGKKAAKTKSSAPAKYRGPNGELWAGGPGRKPEWVRAVLASGKDISEFLI